LNEIIRVRLITNEDLNEIIRVRLITNEDFNEIIRLKLRTNEDLTELISVKLDTNECCRISSTRSFTIIHPQTFTETTRLLQSNHVYRGNIQS